MSIKELDPAKEYKRLRYAQGSIYLEGEYSLDDLKHIVRKMESVYSLSKKEYEVKI